MFLFSRIILFSLFLGAWVFPVFIQPASAGCCECKPPGYVGGSFLRDCRSEAFSVNDCETKCLNSNPDGFEEGYPKFSHSCDTNNCPKLNEASCCVYIKKLGGEIQSCEDITSISECQPPDDDTNVWFQDKACNQVQACGHIGEFFALQGINDNLGNIPEAETEKQKPLYFIPQVGIPGEVKIGGGVFSVNKGQGISVDGDLLAKYLKALFNWLIGAIGIVAVAYLAFGGMQWLAAAGNAQGINKAKETIRDSIIGILLAVSSFMILYIINPNLVFFTGLDVVEIDPKVLEDLMREIWVWLTPGM